jgi:hypothetical protein
VNIGVVGPDPILHSLIGCVVPRHLKHRRGRIQRIDHASIPRQSYGHEPGAATHFENSGVRTGIEFPDPP